MKEMKNYLNIEGIICFYSARKTFSQFASELGIPDEVIDYCLGHSNKSKGVIRFYTKVKQKQAEIAINRVIDLIYFLIFPRYYHVF
jgi:intergrase/recombinase